MAIDGHKANLSPEATEYLNRLEERLVKGSNTIAVLESNSAYARNRAQEATTAAVEAAPTLLVPEPPTNLNAVVEGVWGEQGAPLTKVTLTWEPSSLAVTGEPIQTNMFEVFGREFVVYADGDLTAVPPSDLKSLGTPPTATLVLEGGTPNTHHQFFVRARSVDGVWSELSDDVEVDYPAPSGVLAAPTAPIADTSTFGGVALKWDGLLIDGPTPPQFRYVYAGMQNPDGVTYTRVGQTLIGAGGIAVVDIPVGETHDFALFAVNSAGEVSLPSAIVTATIDGVDVSGIQSDIAGLQTDLSNLDTALSDAQSDATQALSDVATAQAKADSAFTNAATAQSAADSAQSDADAANAAALAASGLAASKGKVIYSTTAPTGADAATTTLWIDTTSGANTPKRWVSGTTWTAVTDKAAIDAAAAAAAAQSTANTAQANAATAQSKADSAFNNAATAQTAANTAQSKADSAFTNAATAQSAANAAQSTANTAQTNASNAQDAADDANTAALAAAGIANSKGKVIYSTTAPTGADAAATTLWIDTTGGANTPKRWVSGTTWAAVTDKTATDAASAAATAQSAANSAQSTANTAVTNAATAQSKADTAYANAATAQTDATNAYNAAQAAQGTANSALTTANGKNKIIFSTSDASGTTGYVNGDVWFKKTGSVITGQWEFVAGAWASRTIDGIVIANLDAGQISTGFLDAARIAAGTIVTNMMTANSINGDRITTNTLAADKIIANSITSAQIAALTITANELAANSVEAGKIKAGALDAFLIVGGNIQTDAAPSRGININSAGLTAYDALGVPTVTISSSTGAVTITGNFISGSGNSVFKATTAGIQLGNDVFGSAPFRVTADGALTATNATITGNITATSGTFTGTVNATSGTISGALSVTGSLTGGTVRTASTGNRIEMNADKVWFYSPSGYGSYITSDNAPGVSNSGQLILGTNDGIGLTISRQYLPIAGTAIATRVEWLQVTGDVTIYNGVVRINTTGDASATSLTHAFQIGVDSGLNTIIDNNEMIFRNNGVVVGYVQHSGQTLSSVSSYNNVKNSIGMGAGVVRLATIESNGNIGSLTGKLPGLTVTGSVARLYPTSGDSNDGDTVTNLRITSTPQIGFYNGTTGKLWYNASSDTAGSSVIYGNALSSSWRAVYISSANSQLGYVASTRNLKNIHDEYVIDVEKFLNVKTWWYDYKADAQHSPRAGMIAEELNVDFPEFVQHTDGVPDGIGYEFLSVGLHSVVKQLNARIVDLENTVASLVAAAQ